MNSVQIQAVGNVQPDTITPSGAPLGVLIGKTGRVVGRSSTYNDSSVVDVDGVLYELHNQNLA